MWQPEGATGEGRCDMHDEAHVSAAGAVVSRRQAIIGLAAVLAAGASLTTLKGTGAREAEPGDHRGGRGNDDHGRGHRRHRHGRRHT